MTIAILGEALIDLISSDDGTFRPHLGGSPYNVAIGLARQGIKTSYLSSLSDDIFGDQLHQSLVREGVGVPLKRRSLWPTSIALVTVDHLGQATYRLYREGIADKDTSFEEVVENLPDDLRVFHTGSLAITPSQLPKIRKIFDLIHQRDLLISVDINIRLGASIDEKKYLDGVRSLLKDVDIVKASDDDLAAFQLAADARQSAEIIFKEMGSGLLLLTLGTGGAVLFSEQGAIDQPSYPVPSRVDAVGAGDTFHSAFLACLSRSGELSRPISECSPGVLASALDFACAAAAINLARPGCSAPTQQEVTEFMAQEKMLNPGQ
ncbi:MAG: PfkB family carbohydrate kinase [Xanthomonadales bacterium]|nr:PfkB family carbohydrate kinase [Xanthomonadales bacterium]